MLIFIVNLKYGDLICRVSYIYLALDPFSEECSLGHTTSVSWNTAEGCSSALQGLCPTIPGTCQSVRFTSAPAAPVLLVAFQHQSWGVPPVTLLLSQR